MREDAIFSHVGNTVYMICAQFRARWAFCQNGQIGMAQAFYKWHWVGKKTKKEAQSFTGLAKCMGCFIKDFSAAIAPITNVWKKGLRDRFFWAEKCQMGFGAIKQILSPVQVLANSDFDKPLVVRTYDSVTGLESPLLPQVVVGCRLPYLSKNQLSWECSLAIIEEKHKIMIWDLKEDGTLFAQKLQGSFGWLPNHFA